MTKRCGPSSTSESSRTGGIDDVDSHLIYDIEGAHNTANRDDGLKTAGEIGSEILSLERATATAA